MIRYVRTVTAPMVEPVTVQEARLWCRIDADDTTQDAMLNLLIYAARERAEEITGRAFASRTLELVMDAFPDNDEAIELPHPPLASLSYVTYADGTGIDQTLSGSPNAFLVDTASYPGRIAPLYGESWPAARAQIGAVRIGYVAGYATTNLVPKSVREYIMARISTRNENRELLSPTQIHELPRDFCDGMLDGLRVKTGFV